MLVAALGGLVATFSIPPFGFWPLGFVGIALVFAAVDGAPARWRAGAGVAAGLALYGVSLAWMGEFTNAWVIVPLLEAAFLALAMGLADGRGRWSVPIFVAAWVAGEGLRGWWPFGGLPLGGVALGQARGPLAEAARVGGMLLVAALTALSGASLAVARRRPITAAVGAAVVIAMVGLGAIAPRGTTTTRERTALVQGGGDRGFLAIESDEAAVFDRHLSASNKIEDPVELILWPEDVIDLEGPVDESHLGDQVGEIASRHRATLVGGVVEGDGRLFHNAAVAWGPSGSVVDRYEKARRVPFGEYVPLRTLLARVGDLSPIPRDAIAGSSPGVLVTPAGRLGVIISYEIFFTDRARHAVRNGGEVLLFPTNAASFSTTQVPTQQLASARLRALETGRWVLQVGPTGYAAVVDEEGRVLARSVLDRAEVIHASIERRRGSTPYAVTGDAPLATLTLLALLANSAAMIRRRRGKGRRG
ncbi:MAG TPA: apolipoprotein N-acyltransferase [Acidimicrobiales bacterium]|nr:apolipoprotein N-acyltransferase [Acidimicrobiales bacterium]